MSDYKNLKGKKIKFLTTDLSSEQSEGEIFYSDTDNDFKSVIASAAWSSAGAMITATGFGTHSGPNSNSFYVGGLPVIATTQHYNGTGWTLGGDYPSARYGLASAGTQTAGLAFGGEDGSDNKTNVSAAYDGSSWTAGPNINSARGQTSGTGTQTSALLAGGRGPGGAAMVTSFEEWNGTSWANLTAISQARGQHFMSGPETATFIAGGGTGNNAGSPITNLTEEFDGSSLSSGGNLNTARAQGGSSGNSGDGLVFAGASNEKNTEQYNGTSWTETSDMTATHRGCGNGAGSISNSKGAVVAGAYPAVATTEEWNITANTVTGAAWASGGNVVNTRRNAGCLGTQTATLYAGGFGPPTIAHSEEYNGTAWTEGNNLPRQRECATTGFGTQTAGAVSGGNAPDNITSPYSGYSRSTDHYDGTSWSEGGLTNTARLGMASCGTLTAGFGAGGYHGANHPASPPSNTVNCEQYDGSSWTEVANLNTAKSSCGHFGTQTASLAIRGAGNNTESWNGSSWTNLSATVGAFNGGNHGAGIQTSGLVFGPRTANNTEEWNGTTWFSNVSYSTSRGGNSAGTSSSAILVGGFTGSGNSNATEEFTNQTTALNLKTITDS